MFQCHAWWKMIFLFCSIVQLPFTCKKDDIMKYNVNFDTQYNQFYIADLMASKKTDDVNFWSAEAYEDRLAMSSGIVGVGTECYGTIKGELVLLDSPNNNSQANNYDHIVEGGLQIKSGYLEVLDCPTNTKYLKVKVASGTYRVRIYSSNLKSVDGDKGNDFYKIEIWPDDDLTRKVIKRYDK